MGFKLGSSEFEDELMEKCAALSLRICVDMFEL